MKTILTVLAVAIFSLLGGIHTNSSILSIGEEEIPLPSIRIGDTQVRAGQAATVDIFFEHFVDISAISFLVIYDADVLSITNTLIGDFFANNLTSTNTSMGGVFYFSSVQINPVNGSGKILSIEFLTESDQKPIDSIIQIAIQDASNQALENIEMIGMNGLVRILEPLQSVKSIAFTIVSNHTSVFSNYEIELVISANELNGFAAGTFEILYNPTHFHFQEFVLSSSWNHPQALYVVSETVPGYLTLSYASTDAIDTGGECFTLKFTVIANLSSSSTITINPKSIYDIHLQYMESHTTSKQFFLFPRAVESPKLMVSSYTGPRDIPFEIEVSIEADSLLAAGDFLIQFDPKAGEITELITYDSQTIQDGWIVYNPNYNSGQLRFSYLHETGLTKAMVLMKFTFTPNPDYLTNYITFNISALGSGPKQADFTQAPIQLINSFVQIKKYYTINYLGYLGEVLSTLYVPENTVLTPPTPPQVLGQTFIRWDHSPSMATMDMTIQAVYQSTGVVFVTDQTMTYNGQVQELSITNLPAGATVQKIPNVDAINAGVYPYEFIISHPDYEDYHINATLTIEKQPITIQAIPKSSQVNEPFQTLEYQIIGPTHGQSIPITIQANLENKVGNYPITITADHPNFAITIQGGLYQVKGIPIDLSSITFANQTYVYDGTKKSLEIKEPLPPGVLSVEYVNHELTNVGSIVGLVKFIVDQDYEEPAHKVATLTITPAIITGITFDSLTVPYDGSSKSLSVSDNIAPYGEILTVEYLGQNQSKNAGTYLIQAKLSHPNYQTLTLEATLTITKRETIITEDLFTLDIYFNRVVITSSIANRAIYTSMDGLTYANELTISNLEPKKSYQLSVYLDENSNELASNILTIDFTTPLELAPLLAIKPTSGKFFFGDYDKMMILYNALHLVRIDEQEELEEYFDEWLYYYNSLVDSWNQDFSGIHNVLENILPSPPTLSNYPLAYLPERRREEQ